MKDPLKPLSEQTLVITGATSGHGLATARAAAAAGANVVLVARDKMALNQISEELRAAGGTADVFVADVGDEAQVEAAAAFAVDRFGGFDTWVNNAGIGLYGEALEVPTADHQRIFQTNYWGVVFGSLAAIRHLQARGGGTLINVGSVNSDMPSALLGSYNASKHAVKGFTDSLRIEMIQKGEPISVTLIKPSAIGTPFPEHGRNVTGFEAKLPRPIYAPEVVADAILFAAQHRRRAITVGAAGRFQVFGATVFPGLFDRIASRMSDSLIDRDRPTGLVEGNLYAPQGDNGRADGDQKGRGFSLYTSAVKRPGVSLLGAAAVIGAGVAGVILLRKGGAAPAISAVSKGVGHYADQTRQAHGAIESRLRAATR
ncbi:SDR family oxidoreductase [Brevundimonas sp.]|uniref:SDR family oxidoreductase n=1 Tax=Brevundimonas sp. TaxID=1871086 RepID=UPI001AC47592|nr:SDR family oxidoreductase [Brevundimonas sp.]MBN9466017.1 SDR family NAD(P)-dependent oxidoreductase [Brevundimonas sp.]